MKRRVLASTAKLVGVCLALAWPQPGLAQERTPGANPWWGQYFQHSTRVTLPDGRKLNLLCMGEGRPTVLFEAGSNYGAWAWRKVQVAVSKHNRTCAYDRAGYGGSDVGPTPRDVNALVRDLEGVVAAGRIEGPYVLVGHSLGGPVVRVFTDRHPRDVVGMVLVDPGHQRQHERFSAVAAGYAAHAGDESVRECERFLEQRGHPDDPMLAARCIRPPPEDLGPEFEPAWRRMALNPSWWATAAAEYEAYHSTDSAEIEASQRRWGALPLIVLTADFDPMPVLPLAQRMRMRMVLMQMHDEAAALSTKGSNRLISGAPHEIHEANPDVVIAAVEEVLRDAASSGSGKRKLAAKRP